MTHPRRFAVLAIVQAGDIITTAGAISLGATEANPIGRGVLSPFTLSGLALLVALKVIVSAGFAWLPVRFVWAAYTAFMVAVVGSNALTWARL